MTRETAFHSEERGSTQALPGMCVVCLRNVKKARKSPSSEEYAKTQQIPSIISYSERKN